MTATAADRPRPTSPTDLFFSFTLLALQGFGGVLAVVQRELVERKQWLTEEEFVEEWAVAQIMPGPNVINLALIVGNHYFGWRGALAALAGMLTIPLVIVLLMATAYAHFSAYPGLTGALRGMAAVSAGLIAASGLKLGAALRRHPLPLPVSLGLSLVAIVAVIMLAVPLPYVLLGVGGASCWLTYGKLRP